MRLFIVLLCITVAFFGNRAHSNLPSSHFIQPDLLKPVVSLDQGALVEPLCDSILDDTCFQQWTALSQTLAISEDGNPPFMEDFLPVTTSHRQLSTNTSMRGWQPVKLFSSSRETSHLETQSSRTYYSNKLKPDQIRQTNTNSAGQVTSVKEGMMRYVSVKNMQMVRKKTPEDESQSAGGSKLLEAVITQDTVALPVKIQNSPSAISGCAETEPKKEQDTEAQSFCEECDRDIQRGLLAVQTVAGTIDKLKRLLRAVETGDESFGKWAKHGSVQRITERISAPEKRGIKICAPETVLKNIVKNFNDSCEPAQFKEFFPTAYCQSCNLNTGK